MSDFKSYHDLHHQYDDQGRRTKVRANLEYFYYSFETDKTVKKIAGFDMDSTLIKTKSGKTFSVDADDWQFMFPNVIETLQNLHKDGYTLLLYTNQSGIKKGKTKLADIAKKINAIRKEIGVPMDAMIAGAVNRFRKPMDGAWKFYLENKKTKKNFLLNSFYVGDAAGRIYEKGKPKKDFSPSDRLFAENMGLKFMLPEDIFQQEVRPHTVKDPYEGIDLKKLATQKPKFKVKYPKKQEMVIMVGEPASGKSSFSRKFFSSKGYEICNQDTLKTKAKCKKMAKETLEAGKSIVIDATNYKKAMREVYTDLAEKYNVPVRIFIFRFPRPLVMHLNNYRVQMGGDKIKMVVYYTYWKYFEEPDEEEGEIIEVPFIPDFPDEEAMKQFLYKYDIEGR